MEEKEKDEFQELRELLEKEKARADANEEALKKERAARVEDAKKYVFGTTTTENDTNEAETDEDDDGVTAAAQRIAERLNAKYNKKNKTKGA